jgi:hypothetical protein
MQNPRVNVVDPDRKWLYKVGGISATIFGITYITMIGLYHPMGSRPSGAAASNEAQLAAAIAAATHPSALIGSNLVFVYNTFTLSVGILMTGLVVLKRIFNKSTGLF